MLQMLLVHGTSKINQCFYELPSFQLLLMKVLRGLRKVLSVGGGLGEP